MITKIRSKAYECGRLSRSNFNLPAMGTHTNPGNHMKSLILIGLCGLAFLTGCETPIKTDFKPDAPFASYRSFSIIPLPQTGPPQDPGLMLRLGRPATDAITAALTAKSYQLVQRENADFAVNLRGASIPKVDVTNWGYHGSFVYGPYGRATYIGGPAGTQVRNYNERTITIEIFENRSHDLVWTGSLTEQSSRRITPEKLKEDIHRILEKFPPTQK